jgi:large subunit ribosomal protein L17
VRHQRSGKKLGRDASHRKALYSNLAGALITHGRIKTTVTKAKAVRPIAEQMITLGRRGDLHARRQAMAYLRSQQVVHTLFADVKVVISLMQYPSDTVAALMCCCCERSVTERT